MSRLPTTPGRKICGRLSEDLLAQYPELGREKELIITICLVTAPNLVFERTWVREFKLRLVQL